MTSKYVDFDSRHYEQFDIDGPELGFMTIDGYEDGLHSLSDKALGFEIRDLQQMVRDIAGLIGKGLIARRKNLTALLRAAKKVKKFRKTMNL